MVFSILMSSPGALLLCPENSIAFGFYHYLYFISIYYCYNYYYYYNHHHHTVVPETDLLLNGEKLCQGKKHHIQASGISSKISVLRRRNVKKKLMKFLVKG